MLARLGLPVDRSALRPASRWDVAVAVAVGLLYALSVVVQLATNESVGWPIGPIVWAVPIVAIAWRTRSGEFLLAVTVAAIAVSTLVGGPKGDIALVVAVYTIGVQRTWRRAVAAWLIAVAAATISRAVTPGPEGPFLAAAGALIAAVFIFGGPAAIGLYLGTRRAYVRTLQVRAADLERERELLERERDLRAREAVAVERARIARELHDVVAHHVSVIVIQAHAAEGKIRPEDTQAREAVDQIAETGREAMSEMRRLLAVLRSEAADGQGEAPDLGAAGDGRAPQPGVDDLGVLAARIGDAGVAVTYAVSGRPVPLPRLVDLSVYRVAQEALTNTLRHAGRGATARLEIRYEPDAVTVEVSDDGGRPRSEGAAAAQPAPDGAPGHGLVGMRERVALFGGSFEAGPVAGRGYRVRARFPVETEAAEVAEVVPAGAAAAADEAPA